MEYFCSFKFHPHKILIHYKEKKSTSMEGKPANTTLIK